MDTIDINCDLAEGGKNDTELMGLISSCNIACGGHFGSKSTVAGAVHLAIENKVNIGAHPSYPDRINFGRKSIALPLEDLRKTMQEQIMLAFSEAKAQGGKLHHVKPHGALYHDLMKDEKKAALLVELIQAIDEKLILFVPPNSVIKALAKGKLKTFTEGFADRSYKADYGLVPRHKSEAVLQQKEVVLNHVLSMVKEERIPLKDGGFLPCKLDTLCVHGDNPKAVEILQYLYQELSKHNVQISSH